ncbi:MAG: diguanylate cyclase [Candidatus Thiodiazotropha sp.]
MVGLKSVFVKPFVIASLSLSMLLLLIVGGFFYTDFQTELQIITERERSQTMLGAKLIERRLDSVARDVLLLAKSVSLNRYGELGSREALHDLGREFRNTSCLKGSYDQVRFLDESGRERVRVNYREGDCQLVAEKDLQNKKTRYYFNDTFKLGRQQIFISPLDLNIEHGVIERPLKPMIRIGTPVFNEKGQKFGIVLVNYFGKELISDLTTEMSGSDGIPMLLNRNGYWLLGADSGDEWGFMFKNEKRIENKHPESWREMSTSEAGQIMTASGLFTWRTVYPLAVNSVSSTGSTDASGASATYIDRDDYFWKVVTHIPQETIEGLQNRRIKMALVLLSLLILLAFIAAYLIGRSREKELLSISALKVSEHRQRAITSKLAEGLMVLDKEGKLINMNPEAERLLGWSYAMLSGQRIHEWIHKNASGKNEHECPILNVIKEERIYHVEEDVFRRSDGTDLPVAYTASPYIVEDEASGVIVAFEDISERKKLKEELVHQATHDALTGLLNRREIENLLDHAFSQAMRYGRDLSVCMIDIDHFKQINDTFGHRAGDDALKSFGQVLDQKTRSADLAGRYGGEEFVVVLTETSLSGAMRWAEQLRATIESTPIILNESSGPTNLTVSIGVSSISNAIENSDQLMDRADSALYLAKGSGRNKVSGVGE